MLTYFVEKLLNGVCVFKVLVKQERRRERTGMMGEHGGNQDRLFYSFNLDEHVPADHLLRGIDRFLDLSICGNTSHHSTATREGPQSIPS